MNLEEFKSKAHFNAPDGYFDRFEEDLLLRVKQKETLKKPILLYVSAHRLIAAVLALLLLFGAYNIRVLMKETPLASQMARQYEVDSFDFIHAPLLSDAELIEMLIQPVQVKQTKSLNQVQQESSMPKQSFITDETLIEEGLIDFNDPALHEFGVL